MKRFAVSLISSILAFTAGIFTASSWNSNKHRGASERVIVNAAPCPPVVNVSPAVNVSATVPPPEVDIAQGRMKVAPEQVKLTSERLRYNVDVNYPQIVGSDALPIRSVNQNLSTAANRLYEWALDPVKSGLPDNGVGVSGYNTVNFTYEVNLATETFLSVNFMGYSFGPGNKFPEQRSFAVNYDLKTGKQLKLTDIFRPGSKYLDFIADYCTIYLSSQPARLIGDGIAATPSNFENWYITANGISFYFPACKVMACAEGEQTVQIEFDRVKTLLNPDVPGKFQITYP